jgi:TrmH family RNA methyltransferase
MITSVQNPLVKEISRLKSSRAERYRKHQVVVEGHNLLEELLSEEKPDELLLQEGGSYPEQWEKIPHTMVSAAVMRKVSDCEQPPGALAVFPMPQSSIPAHPARLLILAGIADPGNLGTLLRSAAAFGWSGVYLLEGCCDPYNPKAIRAAKGATFRLPFEQGSAEKLPEEGTLLVADLDGAPYSTAAVEGPIYLLLGNEAHGVGSRWVKEKKITIPMEGEMESLNVAIAGSILMEHFRG